MGLIAGLLAGFIEEIGWTGYAYPSSLSERKL
jgi:membrane protease YdiL (CAAX protease family)